MAGLVPGLSPRCSHRCLRRRRCGIGRAPLRFERGFKENDGERTGGDGAYAWTQHSEEVQITFAKQEGLTKKDVKVTFGYDKLKARRGGHSVTVGV